MYVITCIYKSGDHILLNDYRPISVLSAFSKIIEKLVSVRLVHHFMCNNLFTSSLFTYIPGFSTNDAVQYIANTLYDSFDKGKTTVCLFLALKKRLIPSTGKNVIDPLKRKVKDRKLIKLTNITSLLVI